MRRIPDHLHSRCLERDACMKARATCFTPCFALKLVTGGTWPHKNTLQPSSPVSFAFCPSSAGGRSSRLSETCYFCLAPTLHHPTLYTSSAGIWAPETSLSLCLTQDSSQNQITFLYAHMCRYSSIYLFISVGEQNGAKIGAVNYTVRTVGLLAANRYGLYNHRGAAYESLFWPEVCSKKKAKGITNFLWNSD